MMTSMMTMMMMTTLSIHIMYQLQD